MPQPMTNQRWSAIKNPEWFLEHLPDISQRKWRLFHAACCRRFLLLLPESEYRRVCEEVITRNEQFADGLIGEKALREEHRKSFDKSSYLITECTPYFEKQQLDAIHAVIFSSENCYISHAFQRFTTRQLIEQTLLGMGTEEEPANLCRLIRCVYENPYRSISFDPQWATPSATAIANGIYLDNDFTDAPILADALEEAGCTDQTLLDHFRNESLHCRGCWAVDAVLGYH